MKVIIQDAETKRYLSTNGRWVAAENDAQDFMSLLPAYNFAKNFTSGRFEVVLYSPDDNYRTSIIEGEGKGSDSAEAVVSCVVVGYAKGKQAKHKKAGDPSVWSRFNACMTSTRNYLN